MNMNFDKTTASAHRIERDDYTCDIGYDKIADITYVTTDIPEVRRSLEAYAEKHPEEVIYAKRTVYTNGENWDIKLKGWGFWRHD